VINPKRRDDASKKRTLREGGRITLIWWRRDEKKAEKQHTERRTAISRGWSQTIKRRLIPY